MLPNGGDPKIVMKNRFKGINWLITVLQPLAVILMEAFWVYPWLVWLGVWPAFAELRPALSPTSVMITLAASLLVTRVSLRQQWPMWLIRCLIIGGGLVIIFLMLRVEYGEGYAFLDDRWFIHVGQMLGATLSRPYPVLLALAVLLYLWWRGITLGRATPSSSSIYSSFLLGIVALITLIVLWQISSLSGTFEGPMSSIGIYVMFFFFFGLLSIAICHIDLMRSRMTQEDTALTTVWRWLLMVLGVIGGIVVVGMGAASIFSFEFLSSIGQVAKSTFDALGNILNYILIPIGYLIEGFYYLLRLIVNWLQTEQLPQSSNAENAPPPETPEVVPTTLPPEVTLVIKWLIVAVIVAAIIYFLIKAIYRYRTERTQPEIEEVHESLWNWGGFKDDLWIFLSMMGGKLKRKPARATSPRYYTNDDISGRLDIREIYWHLLWEGARSGIARGSHETACEYSERLEQAVPDGREQLVQLTDLYNGVRYGDFLPKEEQVDIANGLWQTLRNLLRGLRGGPSGD
jgi:hypothetical protein